MKEEGKRKVGEKEGRMREEEKRKDDSVGCSII